MSDATRPETPAVLQARRFELVDGDGAVRAVLGQLPNPNADDPPIMGFTLLDGTGRQRAWLALLPTGPNLTLDHGGNVAVEIGVDDIGAEEVTPGVYLHMCDRNGWPGVTWRVSSDGVVVADVTGVTA